MIYPIVTPNIDFATLLTTTKKILGRNLNTNVDSNKNVDFESPLAFLCELLELAEQNSNTTLVGEFNLIEQLSYSFLSGLEDEDIILIRCYTQLSIIISEEQIRRTRMIVIGGNLLQWKNAVVYFAGQSHNIILKQLAKYIYMYFEELRLSAYLWSKYTPIFTTNELRLELK